ncbi:cofilin family protein [Streptomyces sp. NPDC055955]|uniref:cofilin family protein n=1 Tax=Streptomyces sp. NPDC055955 TaxID=3345665 RepID=UPI0035E2D70A
MTSAISVEDRCIDAFDDLKRSRHITTVLYRLNDSLDTLTLDFAGNLTHDELLNVLPSDPRLVVYELCFADRSGNRQEAIVLIAWSPQDISPEQGTAQAACYAALRSQFEGIDISLEATSRSDLEYNHLVRVAQS